MRLLVSDNSFKKLTSCFVTDFSIHLIRLNIHGESSSPLHFKVWRSLSLNTLPIILTSFVTVVVETCNLKGIFVPETTWYRTQHSFDWNTRSLPSLSSCLDWVIILLFLKIILMQSFVLFQWPIMLLPEDDNEMFSRDWSTLSQEGTLPVLLLLPPPLPGPQILPPLPLLPQDLIVSCEKNLLDKPLWVSCTLELKYQF